jgi:outer membrane protein assembly complex protein YaeT
MLLHVKNFIFLFLLTATYLFPQSVKQIDVSGNSFFSKNDIIEWSGLSTGSKYRDSYIDTAKTNISKNLAQRGYFFSRLQEKLKYSSDSSSVTITITISEGQPALIRKIELESPDSAGIVFSGAFNFLEGQIFNKALIESNINAWLSNLENRGYPFANASVKSFAVQNDSADGPVADIRIYLDQGMHSRINKIAISGNTSTKDYVIIRELRLNEDQVYSQQQIEEFPKRLNRLRFFEPVTVPEFYLSKDNEGILLINVKEKQTNNFDGIIGYVPSTGTQQSGYLTGLVNVNMRNIFGTGRALAVKWQQYDRHSQEMELRYLEPWILDYPFTISAGLFQRKQDTSYVQRRFEGMLEFLATEDISAGLTFSTENVIPTLSEIPRFTVYNSGSFSSGINLRIDTRDDPYAPTGGFYFFNSYTFSRKKIYGPAEFITTNTLTDINLQRLAADFTFFYQIFNRQIIAAGIHGRELRGPSFEESDLFRLGGTNTLRGFRENQFFGSRLLWANIEYRLLLTRRTYAFLFSDNGYYLRKEEPDRNILKAESFKSGYGAGLSLETGIGVLAVSYALAAGDSFSDGKIHFGIVNEF